MMGVDFIRKGMIGGYYKCLEDEVIDSTKNIRIWCYGKSSTSCDSILKGLK